MKKHTAFAALVLPVAVLASLSGCTPPGGSGTPTPSGLAGCVTGHTWNLDVDDTAAQLLAHFQDLGLPATATTGTGTQTMKWDADGAIDIETEVSYEITINEAADHTLVLTQTHSGPATGTFQIEGTQAIPSNWDASDYHVTTTTTVNGTPSGTSPIELPDSELGGVELALTCSGTTLTTLANDGFINFKWTR